MVREETKKRGHTRTRHKDVNRKIGVKMKILQEGDHVVNIWSEPNAILVAVRHLNEEVEIFRLEPDEDGLPRLNPHNTWQITFGDGEIEVFGTLQKDTNQSYDDDATVKVTTF